MYLSEYVCVYLYIYIYSFLERARIHIFEYKLNLDSSRITFFQNDPPFSILLFINESLKKNIRLEYPSFSYRLLVFPPVVYLLFSPPCVCVCILMDFRRAFSMADVARNANICESSYHSYG